MIEALSTPRNRITTLIFLVICVLFAFSATSIGIDDNPPGVLLAFLSATVFILAFAHPWRTTRKFIFLLLASIIGFILFVILNIILDSIAQNPATSSATRNLTQSPTTDSLVLIISMLCAAALLVGTVGSVIMLIRNRRHQKPST
jgi:hypothetical protein